MSETSSTDAKAEPKVSFDGLSGQARKAFDLAYVEAKRLCQDYVGSEHLLVGVLTDESPGVVRLLRACGLAPEEALTKVEDLLPSGDAELRGGRLPLSPRLLKVLAAARAEAARFKHAVVSSEHLLVALADQTESTAGHLLIHLGLTAERLRQEMVKLPPPDNRDAMLSAAALGRRGPPPDPAPRDLDAVLSASPIPEDYSSQDTSFVRDGRDQEMPAEAPRVPSPSDAAFDLTIVHFQLRILQVGIAAVAGFAAGAFTFGHGFGTVGALLGLGLILLRHPVLTAVLGTTIGVVCGCTARHSSEGAIFLGGVLGCCVGCLLGDFRRLDRFRRQNASQKDEKSDE